MPQLDVARIQSLVKEGKSYTEIAQELGCTKSGVSSAIRRVRNRTAVLQFARKASEAFWCANEQGKGHAMHDHLFANQQQLQPEALEQHAATLGLNAGAFKTCLDSNKYVSFQ